ncbi:MAG: DNA-3-methyladenine glycosylase [Actinomycetota bacterium]|jgi:3-methyladenine DNA glycosylase/8-oxoguanine DNA glycosylase|nr:DNA-3-methyladenine glycosylase [Actinomycetota bacterium]
MAVLDRWADACAALSAADPALGAAIATHGPCRLVRGRTPGGAFGALARSICFQQLAGAAASAIHGRFAALYDGRPTPAAVAATPDDLLRSVGLSAAKVASIKDLAAKSLDGTVRLHGWGRMDDDEIVDRLVKVRGIGPWTAQMFLIFTLNRPDVWPTGDLGVRAGYGRMHGLAVAPTPAQLVAAGEIYRPYRSVAAWYCWRVLDGPFT